MRAKRIPNFNQVELAFLSEFAEGAAELAQENGAEQSVLDSLNPLLDQLRELLQCAFADNRCAQIMQIEDFRNDLLEIILDRLDENINLSVEDDGALEPAGMSVESAVREIPEYRASLEILGELPGGEPDFHSRGDTAGHVWDEEHIRMLINRFESGEFEYQAELLGIAERLSELLAVDHRQEMLIQDCGVGENMKELRTVRRRIHKMLEKIYPCIYSPEELKKSRTVLSGTELVIAVLKAEQQAREDAKFSLNDLSHTDFCSFAESKLPDEPKTIQFRRLLDLLLSGDHSKNFIQSEEILYRSYERFVRELTIHLLALEPAQNHPIQERIAHSQFYRKASEAIEKFAELGAAVPRNFSRGDPICGGELGAMLSAFHNAEIREHLSPLRLRPLAEEILEAEEKSREYSAVSVRRNRELTLEQFRQIRAELTERLVLSPR